MKKVCPVCSTEYTTSRKQKLNSKYCSKQCFLDRNKKDTIKNCLQCGKEFKTYPNWIKRGGGKYCSHKCVGLSQRNRIDRTCETCGVVFETVPSMLKYYATKYCSHKCMNIGNTGENHYNWRGGISNDPYPKSFNRKLKDKIRKKDGYKCNLCDLMSEEHIAVYGYDLHVHHIDYVKTNCSEYNLVALCHQCHGRTSINRAYWTDFFKSKLSEEEKCIKH